MNKVFKDQIPPAGGRKYRITANSDGTSGIEDVTVYQQEGTPFGAKEAMQLYDGIVPPGMIAPYAGKTAPAGWLLCDGRAVSRTAYAALFAVIGTTYGAGNGSTTFTLPDLRGNVPAGVTSGHVLASREGERTHTLTVNEMPAHTHSQTFYHYVQGNPGGLNSSNTGVKHETMATTQTGGGQPHNNMQPTIYLHYIIKT